MSTQALRQRDVCPEVAPANYATLDVLLDAEGLPALCNALARILRERASYDADGFIRSIHSLEKISYARALERIAFDAAN